MRQYSARWSYWRSRVKSNKRVSGCKFERKEKVSRNILSIPTVHPQQLVFHELRATIRELLFFPETDFDVGSAFTHAPLPSSVETNTLRARSDLADPVSQPKHKPTYGEPDGSLDRGNPHYCENLGQLFHQQQQMIGLQQKTFQSMASTSKQGFSLPKPDISKFAGNPLDYWNFVRSFEQHRKKRVG